MGNDDRDYMRPNQNRWNSKRWNDRKARVELDDSVPSGRANRTGIGKDPAETVKSKHPGYAPRANASRPKGVCEPWFEPKNQGFDYQKNRWRPARTHSRAQSRSWLGYLPFGLSLLLIAIPLFGDAKRRGWIPDFSEEEPFPGSGSVTVARSLSMKRVTSSLEVQTDDARAVVQLFNPDTSEHVISIYVAGNDHVRVPVPRGTYEMRLIEGSKWHGPERFFGPNTSYETAGVPMIFEHRRGHSIDLRRSPQGNLRTRVMMTNPDKL